MSAAPARRARGEERIATILDAAERILIDRGAEGLTLRGVAAACSVRLGHLQHFFASRAALVDALLARVLARSEAHIRAGLARLDSRDEASVDRALSLLLKQQRDPALVRVFYELWALGARDASVARALHDFYRTWSEAMMELVTSATHKDRAARARLFVCCLEGISLLRSGVIGRSDRAFDSLARDTLRAILLGRPASV